jgi:hypothetical protein
MIKKLLANRSIKTIRPEDAVKVAQALRVIQSVLGEPIAISEEEYKSLRKISDKLKQETDEVFFIAKANPNLVEAPVSLLELEKDKSFYEFCEQLEASLLPIVVQAQRERTVSGAEYFNGCGFFETGVEFKAAQGIAQAQQVQLLLNKIKRNKGGNSKTRSKKA